MMGPILPPAAALRGNEMMGMFRESFKKLPKIVAGEATVELPPSVALLSAAKRETKKKVPKLF